MNNLALPRIQNMAPYLPPLKNRRGFDGVLLDFNERTIPADPTVRQALRWFLEENKLQVYPEYFDLTKKIAQYVKVPEDEVMLTNGSDQGMDLIFRTFTDKNEVIIPSPSFAMFYQCAAIMGNRVIRPLYREKDMAFPLADILQAITPQTKLIVICNPNNPTGTAATQADMAQIARRAPRAILYVDEAYGEYARTSAIPLLRRFSNIIISRTFSKAFGLGSLRVGYLVARPLYINELMKVRGPYDVNVAGYVAADAALRSRKKMKVYVREVMDKAKPMMEKFFQQNDILYFPSQSNFILFKPENPESVFNILKENGFLVRPQKQIPIQNSLRVTIGTVAQMKKFISVYTKKILPQKYAILDRDGTLIFEPQDTFQIDSLDILKILPNVTTGLRSLLKQGYRLVMVTNQDGLGTQAFPKKKFTLVQKKLLKIFAAEGIVFDRIFICPHLPTDNCTCRKPRLGLLEDWLQEQDGKIDLKKSFVCGDRTSDQAFARNIGVRFIPMQTNGSFGPVIKKIKSIL